MERKKKLLVFPHTFVSLLHTWKHLQKAKAGWARDSRPTHVTEEPSGGGGGRQSTLGSGCKEKATEVLTKLSGDVKMHHTQEWSHTELYVELT